MLKILHIEDNEICLDFVSLVALKGQNIVQVTTGEKAIELCKKETFDLILQDIGLPGINGFKTINLISEVSKSPVFFVFLTCHREIVTQEEMEELERRKNIIFCGMIDKTNYSCSENLKSCVEAVAIFKRLKVVENSQKHKPLSPAEKDILLDLKKKMLPKQIAVKRDASVRTIYTHKNNINQKLGDKISKI